MDIVEIKIKTYNHRLKNLSHQCASTTTLSLLFAISVDQNLYYANYNVPIGFLNGILNEILFMEISPCSNFGSCKNKVFKPIELDIDRGSKTELGIKEFQYIYWNCFT